MKKYAYLMDNELTEAQKGDLNLLMALKTQEDKQNWIDAVDQEDFYYGLALLQVAALKELDKQVNTISDCVDSVRIWDYIKSLN